MHPLTIVTFLGFLGAGFHVFQTKEEVAKLDRELRDIRRQTEQEAGRTQILGAEWARLNDQERLRQLAANHLRHMQPMEPAQFQRLEDAQRRMPAAGAFQAARTGFEPRTDIAAVPGEALVVTLADLRAPAAVQVARAPAPQPTPAAPAPAPAPAPAAAAPSPVAPPVVLAAARPAAPAAATPAAPAATPAAPAAAAPAPRPAAVAAARPAPIQQPRRTELAALPPVATPAHQPRPPQPPISNLPASPNSAIPQPPIRTAMATAPLPAGGSLLGGASLPPPVPFR